MIEFEKIEAQGPGAWALAGNALKPAQLAPWRGLMPEYVIEREMPGVGQLGPGDLKARAQASCSVLRDLGPQIQWVNSYITDNKIYCIYRAPNEQMLREHAERGGLPASKISQVRSRIDPTTAD